MALRGFRSYRSLCRNFSPIDPVEDELARDPSLAASLYLGNISFILSCNPIPGSALVSALISAPFPVPALALPSFDELFK